MSKYMLLVMSMIAYLICVPTIVYSLPNIKIWVTQLNDIDTTYVESSSYFYKLDYLVKEHLKTAYSDDLVKSLRQLPNVSVVNGDSLVESWRLNHPNILKKIDTSHLEQKLSVIKNSMASMNVATPVKEINSSGAIPSLANASTPIIKQPQSDAPKQFLLIGFVKQILIRQNQAQVFNTMMNSVIYTLEIVTNYNVIDLGSGVVVHQFSAVGYGGFARLYKFQPPPYQPEIMVEDAVENLVFDLTHIINFELANTNNLTPLNP